MKTLIIVIFLLHIFLFNFAQQFHVDAYLTGFPDHTIFYLFDSDSEVNIDSSEISSNHFQLTGKFVEPPNNVMLECHYNSKLYWAPLFIGNDNIDVRGDTTDFPFNLHVSGSPTQNIENELMSKIKYNYIIRDKMTISAIALMGDSDETKMKSIWDTINVIDRKTTSIRKDFIFANPNTYAALNEMYYLRNDFSKDSLKLLFGKYSPAFIESKYGVRITNFLKVGEPLKEGDTFYDFTALDPTGVRRRLSNYLGKYILLDFSTTYCGPCINSLSDLKLIHLKYKDSVTIITVSGDVSKTTWIEGYKRDNLSWLSLWDGKGSYSETLLKYGANGFPTFFLIDPAGKIVLKLVGFGINKDNSGTILLPIENKISKESKSK